MLVHTKIKGYLLTYLQKHSAYTNYGNRKSKQLANCSNGTLTTAMLSEGNRAIQRVFPTSNVSMIVITSGSERAE